MILKNNKILNRLHKAFASLAVSFAVFALVLIVSRIFELIYISTIHEALLGTTGLYFQSVRFDIYMLFTLTGQMLIPFFILALISSFLANLFLRITYIFAAIGNIALVLYFGTSSLMLSTDLFGYTLDDITHVAGASGGFSFYNLFIFIIVVALLIFLFWITRRKKANAILYAPLLLLAILAYIFKDNLLPTQKNYRSEQEYYMANNKLGYFLSKTYDYLFIEPTVTEKMLYSYFYTGVNLNTDNKHEYISSDFPFLRKEDKESVLTRFFNASEKKPNIVFIIVESLGRAYVGDGAYLGSFTPFLDSLMKKSLYWENCLSTAGRTFEVLPSVLGSLPYGKNGFAELGISMPQHQSILRILKENNYETSFFYGGDPKFDNMETFMKFQGINRIIGEKDYDNSYKKLPTNSSGFTWGYGDKDIFKKYFSERKDNAKIPFADIILTLAMHDPYRIPEQEKYFNMLEDIMQKRGFDDTKKEEYRKYKENYSTVLYFNDAIRYFFTEYAKRADFNNTIFVITGDHRMSTPAIATQIDRFHVPLIIYSPMLKSGVKFSSFVSHLNITPTITMFLRENYLIKTPTVNHWLAGQVDTAKKYRNTLSVPFIRTKSEIIDYIDNDFFLSGDQLFAIRPKMDIEPIENAAKLSELKTKFDKFKQDNNFACDNNRLAPDSIFKIVK